MHTTQGIKKHAEAQGGGLEVHLVLVAQDRRQAHAQKPETRWVYEGTGVDGDRRVVSHRIIVASGIEQLDARALVAVRSKALQLGQSAFERRKDSYANSRSDRDEYQ